MIKIILPSLQIEIAVIKITVNKPFKIKLLNTNEVHFTDKKIQQILLKNKTICLKQI